MNAPSPAKVTYKSLRDAIADALHAASAHDLADECIRLGLAPQRAGEDEPMADKRRYVKRRLVEHSLEQLLVLGRKVLDDYPDGTLSHLLAMTGARGVDGDVKNIIFATTGPKPEIVLSDALSNVIKTVTNEEFCLVYDRQLPPEGLTWQAMVKWWAALNEKEELPIVDVARNLYRRLFASLGRNGAEEFIFAEYCRLYKSYGYEIPALIPQVYLHYDPYTKRDGGTLVRQRMDFLLLLPDRRRVVIELDGVQHYADSTGKASPRAYAEMVSEDRKIRLLGYEVYRFGGKEIEDREAAAGMLKEFFQSLLDLDTLASDSLGDAR
ncbi:hypothetical protein [Specibacter sp. RAF43]|uniref:hypothetical protein n=1 Tax=Specibacter sp. RAF43 TaxID=3233057 RepID=UPI003F95E2DA